MVNHEFERVIYKTIYGFRTTVLNLYMVNRVISPSTNRLSLIHIKMFGGTNWGNLGHPDGYTSYDIGSPISENRRVHREKYSELKLQANFLQVSPAYLTSAPSEGFYGVFTNTTELVTTELASKSNGTFYIVRHGDWTSKATVPYELRLVSNGRNFTVPQLGGQLSLSGRDSKIHVVDYALGSIKLLYSSAEIFTWKMASQKTVLILYGDAGETHEFALPERLGLPDYIEGGGVQYEHLHSSIVVHWHVEPDRRVVHFGKTLEVHLLWRNEAYSYWTLDLPKPAPIGKFVSASRINETDAAVIVKAGYLLRNASISDDTLHLWGDVNQTTTIEIIASPLSCGTPLFFNGKEVQGTQCVEGRLTGFISYESPEITLPNLAQLEWRYLDSMPEIQDAYDDSLWRVAERTETNNTRPLSTPTSLYASDYGFHSGSLIYRGHFKASGNESSVFLSLSGGAAFGYSVWLDSSCLGSWVGDAESWSHNQTFTFSPLDSNKEHIITVLIDHMGLTQNTYIGQEGVKEPRGILNYSLSGHAQGDITWKLTGNFGGEDYHDLSRGPRNEGAMFAERQGYHLPGAPLQNMTVRSPVEHGIDGTGVGFFATEFDLHVPSGYDVPMSLVFPNPVRAPNATDISAYRIQLFVNGWQFGKYGMISFPLTISLPNYDSDYEQ